MKRNTAFDSVTPVPTPPKALEGKGGKEGKPMRISDEELIGIAEDGCLGRDETGELARELLAARKVLKTVVDWGTTHDDEVFFRAELCMAQYAAEHGPKEEGENADKD